jgi:cysteinyl-tRNA synthetase
MVKYNYMIKIYNTLKDKKETIKPKTGKKIRVFVCGPTVYDYSHLGHARTYIIFDSFVKYLRACGYDVNYLQNITDIDDKIIKRAEEKKITPFALAGFFEKEYLKDMKEIGVDSVTKYAKATSHIKEIISQVERLIKTGYAYQIDDGVYYNIKKFKNYGKLSKRTATGADDAVSRIDDSSKKINRGDFCLWKFSRNNEPSWPSPFGAGRPGWHIEDTAITEAIFGQSYEIHGGARDLIFPHHEAEIAQMEAISKKSPFVKYWMHTGFLTIEGQKMSKSLGNFTTIQDFLKLYPKEFLRFLVIKNLWHSPIDYSEHGVKDIKASLQKINDFLLRLKTIKNIGPENKKTKAVFAKPKKEFFKHLDDDFNTPKALATLFELIREINKLADEGQVNKKQAGEIYEFFKGINKFLGIIDFKKLVAKNSISKELSDLLEERKKAREEKDWEKSDSLRDKIESLGYKLEDNPKGQVIKKI